jgi:hypothetical protein
MAQAHRIQLRSMSSPLLHFLRAFVSGGELNFE